MIHEVSPKADVMDAAIASVTIMEAKNLALMKIVFSSPNTKAHLLMPCSPFERPSRLSGIVTRTARNCQSQSSPALGNYRYIVTPSGEADRDGAQGVVDLPEKRVVRTFGWWLLVWFVGSTTGTPFP
jgi:hypothetical protein